MIKFFKRVGETPLELLERLRIEKPKLKNEKLSYAGRLDPMAEGEMLILIGDENYEYNKHLGYDKEYEATFLIGVSTDTGDVLGKILNSKLEIQNKIEIINLKSQVENLKKIKKQIYPWFSGRKVVGKKLFDHFKEGNLNIERPTLDIQIKEVMFISQDSCSKNEIKEYIFDSIKKVKGDFRQKEILEGWREFFEFAPTELEIFSVKFRVSSGTFIRAFTEEFSFPCSLLKLKRKKIYS